jgi:NADPH-dependent ferric siderophore reductase
MGDEDYDAIPTHVTRVLAAERVSPAFRRLTLGGHGLERFVTIGPDDFVYVLLPPPGRTELTIGVDFSWTDFYAMDEADRPVGAYYTVREHRPAAGELDIDVFLHDDPGPASGWGASAAPGDPVALWGPRTAWHPPAGTDWWLLAADETALPAAAGILETLPSDAVVRVFAEAADERDVKELPAGPNAEVTWVAKDGHAPGPGGPGGPGHPGDDVARQRLASAVRAAALPAGQAYAWGGGESRSMTALRKYLRREVGLAREQVSLVGYWRAAGAGPEGDTAEADDLDD